MAHLAASGILMPWSVTINLDSLGPNVYPVWFDGSVLAVWKGEFLHVLCGNDIDLAEQGR